MMGAPPKLSQLIKDAKLHSLNGRSRQNNNVGGAPSLFLKIIIHEEAASRRPEDIQYYFYEITF